MPNGGFWRWLQHTTFCDAATPTKGRGSQGSVAARIRPDVAGSFLAAHGGMPLVGVKVVPPRRCAAAGAPPGLLRCGIRGLAAMRTDVEVWSGHTG
jgi:hypothetical protein